MNQVQCELCTSQSDTLLCRGCLPGAIWSEDSKIKILAWQILSKLSSEGWAQNLLDQIYLDDTELAVAQAGSSAELKKEARDSNGTVLADGDSVTLIKDLDVKGANFVAKRGLLVKKISLTDDPELIECRVNGTAIFLKTCFLKRA